MQTAKFATLCIIGAFSALTAAAQSAPTPAEQQKLLDAMHDYAAQYISNLPDFICEQVTHQFEAGAKSQHWRKGDTLTSKLSFTQGREQRNLELVNNKPIKPGSRPWRRPLITEGEFGILLSRVFGHSSNAAFTWNRWDTFRGKRAAVFDYSIDKAHSTLDLSLNNYVHAIVPYHGSVFADPDTGSVWRIIDEATELPEELETRSVSTVIDYDKIAIGGGNYLLPTHATVLLMLDDKKIRHEIEFQDYRKFEADSTITFGSSGNSPPKQ